MRVQLAIVLALALPAACRRSSDAGGSSPSAVAGTAPTSSLADDLEVAPPPADAKLPALLEGERLAGAFFYGDYANDQYLWLVFTKRGYVCFAPPPAFRVDYAEILRKHEKIAAYSIRGSKLELHHSDGKVQTEDFQRVDARTFKIKWRTYHRVDLGYDGLTLEGKWKFSSGSVDTWKASGMEQALTFYKEQHLSFTRDGRVTSSSWAGTSMGINDYSGGGASGIAKGPFTGSYAIRGNVITIQWSNGGRTRANFFTVEGKERGFEGIWIGGVAYFPESGK